MSSINIITENIILPLSDIALGQSIKKLMEFLLKSQWWTRKQIVCENIKQAYRKIDCK